MNEEVQKRMLEVSAILFKNNVPVIEARVIGQYIEELIQEKEKEIISLLENKRDSKLYLEVTGYISNLDSYINKLEKQLRQRDFIIKEAIEYVKENSEMLHMEEMENLYHTSLLDILNKYKGDSNE